MKTEKEKPMTVLEKMIEDFNRKVIFEDSSVFNFNYQIPEGLNESELDISKLPPVPTMQEARDFFEKNGFTIIPLEKKAPPSIEQRIKNISNGSMNLIEPTSFAKPVFNNNETHTGMTSIEKAVEKINTIRQDFSYLSNNETKNKIENKK